MAHDRCFLYQSSSPCSRSGRRQPGHGANKRGLNTKIHLAVDAFGMPVSFTVTSGTVSDSSQANKLIADFDAQYLLADRGYDTNEVIEEGISQGMVIVIPPKKNRKVQREYSKEIYENRYQIENTFLKLKRWRGIATRYAKTTTSYVAAVQICCMFLWLQII